MTALTAHWQGRYVDQGELAALWCENDLVPPVPDGTVLTSIDARLLKPAQLARKAAMQLNKESSGPEIKNTLMKHHKVLLGRDRYWAVTRDFWVAAVGRPGEERLRELQLDCFPTISTAKTVQETWSQMERLGKSKMYDFVGVGSQKVFQDVKKLVETLKGKRAPEFVDTSGEYMAKVKERMGYFVRASPDSAGRAPSLGGRVAMRYLLAVVRKKAKSQEGVTLQDLEPMRMHPWLLAEQEPQEVEALLATAVGGGAVAAALAARERAPEKGAGLKKRKAEVNKEAAKRQRVAGYFA